MAVIAGFTPAVESEGRQESLVLALQALSHFHAEAPARPAAGYDLIAALTGISFMTATSFSQPCPAWWILGSRAVHLDFAANAIGLNLTCLNKQPADLDFDGMQKFSREEILPKIIREIEAGRPVLVNGGFPSFGWGLWGVATRTEKEKIFGHTCWFQYEEQPMGEEYPALAAYSIETRDRSKRIPIRDILRNASSLYRNQGEAGWTTGPRAYELWSDQVGQEFPCSEHGDEFPGCYRQMSSFVRDARMTGARFLDFLNEELPPPLRRFLPGIVDDNRAIARLLKGVATAEDPSQILSTKGDRKKYQKVLDEVRSLEESLEKRYEELASQKGWDAPPTTKKKGKGDRKGKGQKRKGQGSKKDRREKKAVKKPEQTAKTWRKIADLSG